MHFLSSMLAPSFFQSVYNLICPITWFPDLKGLGRSLGGGEAEALENIAAMNSFTHEGFQEIGFCSFIYDSI